MNISFLTSGHDPYDDRIFYHMARSLRVHENNVLIVSSKKDLKEIVDGILIDCFEGDNLPKRDKVKQFVKRLTDFKPDFIICSEPLTILAARRYSKDQTDLAVTVYNSNVALVRDVRRVTLPAGTVDLRFMDIAAAVNPATVHIVSLTAPKDLTVLEQNYEYDLLSPQKLLQKYVGKELTLIRLVTENNSTKEVPVKATLLAYNEGPVWQVGNEIITGMGADRYVFPDLPENLYSKPTLVWLLDNRHAGEQTVEASYLTNQMNWNADYVLTIGAEEKAADLNGWVTITNNSGTAYRNAQLQLVAGELNRVTPPRLPAPWEWQRPCEPTN